MSKKTKGGRPTRVDRLKELATHIGEVESGRYLLRLQEEFRELDLKEALSDARGIMGSGGVRMVDAMLQEALGDAEALERLRDHLRTAGLKPSLITRIAGTSAAKEPEPKRTAREPRPAAPELTSTSAEPGDLFANENVPEGIST